MNDIRGPRLGRRETFNAGTTLEDTPLDPLESGGEDNMEESFPVQEYRNAMEEQLGGGDEGATQAEHTTPIQSLGVESTPPEQAEGTIDLEVLEQVERALCKETLEGDKEASQLLIAKGLIAYKRWKGVHQAGTHTLSRTGEAAKEIPPNPFVQRIVAALEERGIVLDKKALILECGSGSGRDAREFAKICGVSVLGIDSDNDMANKASADAQQEGLGERVGFDGGEYVDFLKKVKTNFQVIYGYSVFHYFPPILLRDEILPLIAEKLRNPIPENGQPDGLFCFGMKIADGSDSSKVEMKGENRHIRLAENASTEHRYNPSIDLIDRMFRIYPETVEAIKALVDPSFDIIDIRVVPRPDYDRPGETEQFVEIIARPKKLQPNGPTQASGERAAA